MNSPIFNIFLACAGFSLTCCTNTYEHTSRGVSIPASQDAVQIKRNVYYIIMDGMVAVETIEPFNIATKKEVIDKLSNTELANFNFTLHFNRF